MNRQKGSGTRILADFLCRKCGVDPGSVYGYGREELTHTSVAAQIACGSADAGMGIYSAAKLYDLDFLPVCTEQYDLLILDEVMAAINTGMLSVQQVAELIEHRPPQLELVMTGRNPPQQLVELSDYVSQIEKKKHPFDNGIPARDGIER